MHPSARAALIQATIDSLVQRHVSNGYVGFADAGANAGLVAKIAKEGSPWLQEIDAHLFLDFQLSDEVRTLLKEKPANGLLGEILTRDELLPAAVLVAEWVDSMPQSYTYFFPLPSLQELGAPLLELSDRFALIDTGDETAIEGLHVVERAEYDASDPDARHLWMIKRMRYLRVRISGHHLSGADSESAPAEAFSILRRFLVLSDAADVLTSEWHRDRRLIAVPMESRTRWRLWRPLHLQDEVASEVAGFEFTAKSLRQPGKGLFGSLVIETRPPLSGGDLASNLQSRFQVVTKALEASPEVKGVSNLLAAAEWLFDASAERNGTIAFLQTCIGFESLLGERGNVEEAGITATLSDRVAFLLGRGAQQRDDLRERFKTFYRERSKIVHGRAARLTQRHREQLQWGKNRLREAIQSELYAL